jgi:hypothetical protein
MPEQPLPIEAAALEDVETYISAAETHGTFDDPDHEVGDLQQLLRAAFGMLSIEQRALFALNSDVRAVLVNANVLTDE